MEVIIKKFISIFIKKELLLAILIFAGVLFYLLLLKPNPTIRIDWNKVQLHKGNSTLYLDAPPEINGVGKTFKVYVKVDTQGYIINAVQSYVKFDPRVLEIVKTDTQDSFCRFYPENNYDNDKGIIKLSCGVPYPGFKGKNNIETIEFLAKAITTTQIELTKESMVLANDGHGTNLLKKFSAVIIKVKAGL